MYVSNQQRSIHIPQHYANACIIKDFFYTQEDYKNVMRFFSGEIKRAKVQLELNLIIAVKDSKKCFHKYISNKRRVKENFHHLLNTGEIVTKISKRLRY